MDAQTGDFAGREVLPSCWGIFIGPYQLNGGGVLWAEVVRAPRWNWRPWRGRMARWWYEVHYERQQDECGTTCAYTDTGSGGSFWFGKTVRQATNAAYVFAYEQEFGT